MPDLNIVGLTGLVRAGGEVREEFLRELQGVRGRKAWREMLDNDPIVGGTRNAIAQLIRKVQWEFAPADESAEAHKMGDFYQGALEDMSDAWPELVGQLLSFLGWGWSFFETVYKLRGGDSNDPHYRSQYNDGLIGWRKWAIRAQESLERWQFDPEGGVQAMIQRPAPDYVARTIPIDKALLFRTTAEKGSPEGRSLFRNAWSAYYYKREIQRIEAIGIERDLAGLPVALVPVELLSDAPTSAQTTTLNAIKDLIRNIRRDEQEGVVFPLAYTQDGKPTYELKLLSTGGTRAFDIDKVIARYDQRMAMSVLADFLLLGHEAVGSKALSVDKTELFTEAISAFADVIAAVINQHAVPRLHRLNGWDMRLRPELRHGRIEHVDLDAFASAILKLTQAGMPVFPNADVERHLYETFDLPVPAEVREGAAPRPEPTSEEPEDEGEAELERT